jgi:hypothetical protein
LLLVEVAAQEMAHPLVLLLVVVQAAYLLVTQELLLDPLTLLP